MPASFIETRHEKKVSVLSTLKKISDFRTRVTAETFRRFMFVNFKNVIGEKRAF